MTIPVRHLPLVQNWSCHGCTDCCRIEAVVTEAEKRRIEALPLADDPDIAAAPWFRAHGGGSTDWTLVRRAEGTCVFLTAAHRCRLQERFGAEAKPFACQLFPFLLIPAGSHWRVGLRYACPSAAGNEGQPLSAYEGELKRLSVLLEQHVGRAGASAPPPLVQAGQPISWPDALRLVHVLVEIVRDRGDRLDRLDRLERRLRKCLALLHVCRQSRLDLLGGDRLSEFLNVVRASLESEVPEHAAQVAPPGAIGRLLFRCLLAIYARRDLGQHRGAVTGTRLGRLRAGWRFVRGRGRVPRVNAFLPDTTFEAVAQRPAPPAALDEALERYYLVKLNSLQFCGPPNFGLSMIDGVASLLATLPMILWLTRAFGDLAPHTAVQQALLLVDDHFGGNPILGLPTTRFMVRTLAQRGELERLVARWSR